MRIALLFVAVIGCSTEERLIGSVEATGSLGGKELHLKSAAGGVVKSGKSSVLLVYLSPLDDACEAPSIDIAGEVALEFALYQSGGDGTVPATFPDQYSTDVTSFGPWVEIDTFVRDTNCQPTNSEGKGTGRVVLRVIDSYVTNTVSGTFEFSNGADNVKGSFSTTECAFLEPTTPCR